VNGRDLIFGSDGYSWPEQSDSPRYILAAPRSNGSQQATFAPAWRGSNSHNLANFSNKYHGGNSNKGKGKFCDYCKRPNHTRDNCWKLHGKPANKERKEKEISIAANAKAHQPVSNDQFQQIMRALSQLGSQDKAASYIGTFDCLSSIST